MVFYSRKSEGLNQNALGYLSGFLLPKLQQGRIPDGRFKETTQTRISHSYLYPSLKLRDHDLEMLWFSQHQTARVRPKRPSTFDVNFLAPRLFIPMCDLASAVTEPQPPPFAPRPQWTIIKRF